MIEICKRQVEELEIVCPMNQHREAIQYAYDHDFVVERSGPPVDENFHTDFTKFHLKAHKITSPWRTLNESI